MSLWNIVVRAEGEEVDQAAKDFVKSLGSKVKWATLTKITVSEGGKETFTDESMKLHPDSPSPVAVPVASPSKDQPDVAAPDPVKPETSEEKS